MSTRPAQIYIYRDVAGGWRWSLKSANGQVMARSDKAFTERWRAVRAAREMAASPITLGWGKDREILRT